MPFEKRCMGTLKDGSPCRALFSIFEKLDGQETIVCRKCGHANHFRYNVIQKVQYLNGEKPPKAA
jgi:hypothetical protein